MTFNISSALLEACVLSSLEQEDAYGYILTQKVKEVMSISESTLYPVLRRLLNTGYLMAYDQPFQGRNRRYYHLTDVGKDQLETYRKDWIIYRGQVDKILMGGVQSD
ncbi:MAG: PadR family transcriptional regulator [Massiliimalia sp.]